ncbi:MAG: DUF559 domain-containing protein [Bacteroidales bacterium]|nr:DUF559 domain-containing protein [Bacteroidales bacterium]
MTTTLYNLSYLKETRKYLRENMTEAELVLWSVLKGKNLCGRKFRRQHSIGHYIADFYCTSEKLIIELDGQHHFTKEGLEKDKEVLNNLTNVLNRIKKEFDTKQPQALKKGL